MRAHTGLGRSGSSFWQPSRLRLWTQAAGAAALTAGLGLSSGCSQGSITVAPGDATAVRVPDESGFTAGAPRLTLTMVDVGQGDGFVLTLPNGAVVAFDGGPDRTGRYEDFVNGMPRMDYVLLSHAHSDHYTGLQAAISLLPDDCTARVFDPGMDRPEISGYQTFRRTAGCRYGSVGNGITLNLDPTVSIGVVGVDDAPYPMDDGGGINNTSMVTYVRYGHFAALFTGDAQTEAEQRVYNDHMDLRANVLKIGHHGSCTSTAATFLRTVDPQWALISVGVNEFGHPNCQTLTKLRLQGTHWMRTDSNGNVTIETDGDHYTISQERGQEDDPNCPRDCGTTTDF